MPPSRWAILVLAASCNGTSLRHEVADGSSDLVDGDGPLADGSETAPDGDAALDAIVGCSSAGALDPSFGQGGVVAPITTGTAVATSVLIEPASARILVAAGAPDRATSSFTLLRLTADGQLDPSFAEDGISRQCIAGHACWLEDIALQGDGKIIGVGGVNTVDSARIGLLRYDADGELDATFGVGGVVLDAAAPLSYGVAVVVDEQGRIVVTAEAADGFEPDAAGYFTTVRYLANGARDPSFGVNGVAQAAFGEGKHIARDLALDPDGRIVVAGVEVSPAPATARFEVVRYGPTGIRDPTFGSMGVTTVPFEGGASATGVSADATGRITLAGNVGGGGALAQLTSNGDLDLSFAASGSIVISTAPDRLSFEGVHRLPDGGFIVGGRSTRAAGVAWAAVGRYGPDGTPAPAFGTDGLVLAAPVYSWNAGHDLVMDASGRIVVVGAHGASPDQLELLVARLCP